MKSPAKRVKVVLKIRHIEDPGTAEVSQMEWADSTDRPVISVKNCIM